VAQIFCKKKSTAAIGVQIVNGHGLQRLIRLDPMTGFPHVESVNKEQ
jgi:hypothetical protein